MYFENEKLIYKTKLFNVANLFTRKQRYVDRLKVCFYNANVYNISRKHK